MVSQDNRDAWVTNRTKKNVTNMNVHDSLNGQAGHHVLLHVDLQEERDPEHALPWTE